jgi:hypothetical protein
MDVPVFGLSFRYLDGPRICYTGQCQTNCTHNIAIEGRAVRFLYRSLKR